MGKTMFRRKLWFSGLVSLFATAVACSGNDSGPETPQGGAAGKAPRGGSGGTERAGAGGVTPGGGDAGGRAGNPSGGTAGEGGTGGTAGEGGGGATGCDSAPYEILKVLAHSGTGLLTWPAQRRVGVRGGSAGVVQIYEIGADELTLVDTITREDLGLAEGGSVFSGVAYGDGLIALVDDSPSDGGQELVMWRRETGVEKLLSHPGRFGRDLITGNRRIAIAEGDTVFVAKQEGDTWSWEDPISVPGRSLTPLALPDGAVLVGVEESYPFDEESEPDESTPGGAGGAGGTGGEIRSPGPARVELWVNGQRVEQHTALGNPRRAVELDVGEGNYLITETNSFWGSYNAALELYGESGALHRLVEVPVESSGDAEDGAFDVALHGEQLFVANCESGLLTGAWPGARNAEPEDVTLTRLEGPWSTDDYSCTPTEIEVIGDVLIVGGDNLVFARLCDGQ